MPLKVNVATPLVVATCSVPPVELKGSVVVLATARFELPVRIVTVTVPPEWVVQAV
jgi:hypothetical protein